MNVRNALLSGSTFDSDHDEGSENETMTRYDDKENEEVFFKIGSRRSK
jgi:hypothetical protein